MRSRTFTNDPVPLKKAIALASTQAYSEFAKMSDIVLSQSELKVGTFGAREGVE